MRKGFLLLFLFPLSFVLAEGPKYKNKEANTQLEFDNVYQDLRSKASTSTATIKNLTTTSFTATTSTISTLNVTSRLGVGGNLGTGTQLIKVTEGSSDNVAYDIFRAVYGGGGSAMQLRCETAQVDSVGEYILSLSDALIICAGNDGVNFFRDIFSTSYNAPIASLSSSSAAGGPAARTYVSDGTGLKLTMASGNYNVNCCALDIERR